MADKNKRRVYIIKHGNEAPEDEIYSSLSKVSENLNKKINYKALAARLRRAKVRTGKSRIHIKDDEGNPLIIEIRDIK